PDAEHYPANGTWAEPDLDHAAELMRSVFSDRDDARRRGERAARDVAEQFSPRVVGSIARTRLELVAKSKLRHARADPRTGEASTELADVQDRLVAATATGTPAGASAPARIARRAVLRVMRPFTHHQLRLDDAMVRLLNRLAQLVRSEQLRAERDSGRI